MNVLVVAPHPDDEAIGCGGVIAKHVAAGDAVVILYLTTGERGCPGLSPDEASVRRRLEGQESAALLGAQSVTWFNEPDGALRDHQELRDRLGLLLATTPQDVIYVTHEREAHPDHRAAGRLVRETVAKMVEPPEVLAYEVWTPFQKTDRIVDITSYMEIKRHAIAAHESQAQNRFGEAAEGLASYRGAMLGHCRYAEAFGRMRPTGEEVMKIAIAFLTYSPDIGHPRSDYAQRALESTLALTDPGLHSLHLHIADDGSDPRHIEALLSIARDHGCEPTVSQGERGGYGRSYNLASQALHDSFDLILPLEDDWQMLRPLLLEPLANAIEQSGGEIQSIRLGYMGFTREMRGKLTHHAGQTFLLLDPASEEPHVFAGGPRLETVQYQRDVGPWPEGLSAGNVEWEVTHRWPARNGVAWPLDLCIPASQAPGAVFGHIGSVSIGGLDPAQEMTTA